MAALEQPLAKLHVVINLAIHNHGHGAILVEHRLVTALDIDDREPAGAEPDSWLDVCPARVRTPVLDRPTHAVEQFFVDSSTRIEHSGNSAHGVSGLEAERLNPAIDDLIRAVFAGDIRAAALLKLGLVGASLPKRASQRGETLR
jgi:hypothetical protein